MDVPRIKLNFKFHSNKTLNIQNLYLDLEKSGFGWEKTLIFL